MVMAHNLLWYHLDCQNQPLLPRDEEYARDYDQVPLEGLGEFVSEKLIANPLLIHDRNLIYDCTLPLWALIHFGCICMTMDWQVWPQRKNYEFDYDYNKANQVMHVPNYIINIHNQTDEPSTNSSDDHKDTRWKLSTLVDHLQDRNIDASSLMHSIEDMIIKTMFSIENTVTRVCDQCVPTSMSPIGTIF